MCLCRFLLFEIYSLRMLNSPVVEPHPFQLFTYEPDTENAGSFIVVENIGIDGIDRHGRPPGLQDYEVARLETRHSNSVKRRQRPFKPSLVPLVPFQNAKS